MDKIQAFQHSREKNDQADLIIITKPSQGHRGMEGDGQCINLQEAKHYKVVVPLGGLKPGAGDSLTKCRNQP